MSSDLAQLSVPDSPTSIPMTRIWSLVLITLIYGISIVDRSIFGLMLQPIKKEFGLSDTVLGLIGSLGFALTYALAGLPLSRLADRISRKRVIVIGLACYSLITALTGLAHSTLQLAAARVGLAIGEAAVLPSGTSVISDYFPKKSRSRAMGVLGAGPPIATLVAFTLAGWISQDYGWRGAYYAVGCAGLVLTLVTQFSLVDPARGATEASNVDRQALDLPATLRFLAGQRSYVLLIIGATLMACTMASLGAWGPAFLGRIHHLSGRELGFDVGLISGVGGLGGTLLGGWLSDLIGRENFKWKLLVPAGACVFAAPSILLFLFAPTLTGSLIGLTGCVAFVASQYGALFGTLQSVVRVSVRAFSISVFLVSTTVLGVGLGPVAVGAATDALKGSMGDGAIRYAMLIPALSCLIGGLLMLVAIRYVSGDLITAGGQSASNPKDVL